MFPATSFLLMFGKFFLYSFSWGQSVANSDSVALKGMGMLVICKYSWKVVGKRKQFSGYHYTHCQVPWKGYIELLRSSSCQEKERGWGQEEHQAKPQVLRGPASGRG